MLIFRTTYYEIVLTHGFGKFFMKKKKRTGKEIKWHKHSLS